MISEVFKGFLLPLALLAATVGCHNSPSGSTLTPSYKPAAQSQGSVPTPAPPQADQSQVKLFQVTPPASFSSDQLLSVDSAEFHVAGSAGKFLLVKVREQKGGNLYSVTVMPPGNNSGEQPKALLSSIDGHSMGNWLYALPQTGTYRVMFKPTHGVRYSIEFAILDNNDPVIDPGLKPQQISINFGQFAQSTQLAVLPPTEIDGGEAPAHLALENSRLEFRIMQVAGYKGLRETSSSMELLQAALKPDAPTVAAGTLPYPVWRDSGYSMQAREELLIGDGWRGLRWLGGIGQDNACRPFLAYVFEGMTNDQRFLIMVRAVISHPAVRQRWTHDCANDDAEAQKSNALLRKDLTTAEPGSFEPNLNELDAIVRSLKFAY